MEDGPRTISVNGASLTWRFTPWDSRALGLLTSEITEFSHHGEASARGAVAELHAQLAQQCVELCTARIGAADRVLKEVLGSLGWRFVETSLMLTHVRVQRAEFGAMFRRTVELAEAVSDDFASIRHIAATAFDHSRYHEDPRIGRDACRRRYELWIDDLRAQGKRFLVHRTNGTVAAFMALTSDGRRAELVLGGSMEGAGWLSPLFWASLMERLKHEGHGEVSARVSAANIGVLRIYLALGFTVATTEFGYTWLSSPRHPIS